MKVEITSYCGIDCTDCTLKESMGCKGCKKCAGNIFYGECEVAKCAISKERRFCGECGEFPCELLKSYSYDKNNGDNGKRIEHCKEMKSQLVADARKGIDPVSVCGHHCDYCFMGQWCGGCRSQYNCCSFAAIMPDKVCPNISCANEKGLDGCYDCEELVECTKGYYANENEYIAKATALFIHTYGKDMYTSTLQKAIADGVNYPKTFDESGSVDNSLQLLEEYLK